MTDFWQQGTITVLQRLKNRPIEELESEIEAIARRRRIVLLLPALYAEFETASMPRIVAELKKVKYLHQIVISLDQADREQFQQAKKFVSNIPLDV
jgi:glucosyl-3-phosphoglycerate synthase